MFEQWLETYAKPHCKPSTYAGYSTAWRIWIAPVLGDKPFTGIGRPDVRQVIANMVEAKKSRAYIKGTLAPLSAVFNRAMDDEIVNRNPVLRILPKQRGQSQQRAQFLTDEHLHQVLEAARVHYPTYYPLLMTFARAGLRMGEAVALQVQHVDFAQHCLWIRRNWVKGKIQTPKSGKFRRVDMSNQLASVLKEATANKGPDDLVFPSQAGTFLSPDNFRKRAWTMLFRKAGLPRVRVHDLRHTFASLLIQKGASLAYIKEQMGHHSISITVDIYGHLSPGVNRGEVNKLDVHWAGNGSILAGFDGEEKERSQEKLTIPAE